MKNLTSLEKLEQIVKTYCNTQHNDNNYSIGGGLDGCKFASRRHEDARNDDGKLTLGEATQLFKKATGVEIDIVRNVIEYAVPNMEWHHAGKLPKAYGGGMKKTYFLNAAEICEIATNWTVYFDKFNLSKKAEKEATELRKSIEDRQLGFLKENAIKVERVTNKPMFFYLTSREMLGKYGWFDSTNKSYNMTEYYSGWEFKNQEIYNEFLKIK